MLMHKTSGKRKRHANESGQAAVFLVLAMGIFLIGSMGFVVDGTNLWFHRQAAQTAADAACTAGAMNMLSVAEGATIPDSNWLETLDVQCSSAGTAPAPCQYAAFNGYLASGLKSGEASTEVSVSSGSFSDLNTNCDGVTAPVCAVRTSPPPFMQVDVVDRVPTSFIRMLGNIKTVDVHVKALCGLSNVLSPVPVLVLNPGQPRTFTGTNLDLSVINGAQKGIQVNSIDSGAVYLTGNNTISLTNLNGPADFAVASRETQTDAGNLEIPSGNWVSPAGMVSDPFASIISPQTLKSSLADCSGGSCVTHPLLRGTEYCPTDALCDVYHPGHYPNEVACSASATGTASICVGQGEGPSTGLAVFMPGTYYLDGDFVADTNSCLRPGPDTDIGGTVFYFTGGKTLNVSSNSGQLQEFSRRRHRLLFDCQSNSVDLSSYSCIVNVPSLTGNVLIAPCRGTYGDPLKANSAEGILFFQDRDSGPVQPTWNSAGAFGLIGNIYFHHCGSSAGTDNGASCDPTTAFSDTFSFGSGAQAYLFGGIVVDRLNINQPSPITISLSPNRERYTLKASLLQ